MNTTIHTQAPEVKEIVRHAFPNYAGRRICVEPFTGPMTLNSYWSGGSRDYWAFVDMANGNSAVVPENGTPWMMPEGCGCKELPLNLALVRHTYGHHESVCVYVRPENMTKLLPPVAELTRDQRIVLSATRSLKSSYGGIKDYRFREASEITGIDRLAWDQAKAELITRGLLNAAGAITDSGRNAIGWTNLTTLKMELEHAAA